MDITISAEERNTLFARLVDRLTGIDDVYIAAQAEDWEAAQTAGQEFADLLRFLCEDLGWGERPGEAHVLTSPPDVLRRVVGRVHEAAVFARENYERERDEAADDVAEAKRLQETCERILGGIGANRL